MTKILTIARETLSRRILDPLSYVNGCRLNSQCSASSHGSSRNSAGVLHIVLATGIAAVGELLRKRDLRLISSLRNYETGTSPVRRDFAAHTTSGLALAPRRLTGKQLMYAKRHTTTHRSFVTKKSGEECP
jgi:hypothetical protein